MTEPPSGHRYERAVLHLDLDAFFVAVECLRNDALRGKPLIIGGSGGRGVVASCSYEARRFGVHSAMPVKMALRLCPDAVVLRGDMDRYSHYSHLVTEIIADRAPLFEKASIDEFYLDLTGMDRYFGCFRWSNELRDAIRRESGLTVSFGLAANKLVSKVSTGEVKPDGAVAVPAGTEREYLAPLSTAKLPGVGKETYKKLSFMGVRTIRVLSDIPMPLLERQFGQAGRDLWRKARGVDDSPVVPYEEQKSMSSERTFSEDTLDVAAVRDKLRGMTEQLAFELRQAGRLASCVTVKIRYADFNTFTMQRRLPYTASDAVLRRTAVELFDRLYQRRQLIRLIGVKFSGLVRGHQQIDLFEDTGEEVRLLQAMDHIRTRFGSKAVLRASGL